MNEKSIRESKEWLADLSPFIEELCEMHADMLRFEAGFENRISELHHSHRDSAANLLHYLALRSRDIRPLQTRLASLGLSSLGRAESHALVSVEGVLRILFQLTGKRSEMPAQAKDRIGFARGKAFLEAHTEALLGPKPFGRGVRIMVTMPSEASDDYLLVRDLLANGMDCMRINCAYDEAEGWLRMIRNLERARQEIGKQCRILMDVAGPKLRTGPIEPGPEVVKWRPQRDAFGNVTAPARIWLTPADRHEPAPETADACLPVPGDWLASVHTGDTIRFFDSRGASREMKIIRASGQNRRAESSQTTYMTSGTTLHVNRSSRTSPFGAADYATVGELPRTVEPIILKTGDTLILTRELNAGKHAVYDDQGQLVSPAMIGITLPDVFGNVRPGQAVWLDDGKIGGIIRSVDEDRIQVEVTHARPQGEKLMADKGINLPDSELRLPALTQKDIEDLRFIARHADLVGYSFVRNEADVYDLQSRLTQLGGEQLGIVLKIETRRAFEQLPNLILAAMRSPCAGVMIARGDLAVECGYERMAEVQEEILWICEAAHMPVIWATQVLERLAKEGLPSRAEITDAAMSERAECVMLNKGPYILEAVRVLDDILHRMEAHQTKKVSMLRQLGLASKFSQAKL